MCCLAAAPVAMFQPSRRDAVPPRRRDDAGASLAFDALFEASSGASRTPVGTPPPSLFASATSSTIGTNAADAQEYANGAVLFRLIARACAPRDPWEASLLQAVTRLKAGGGEACASPQGLAASLSAAGFAAHVVSAAGHAGAGLSLKHTFVVVDRPALPGARDASAHVASGRTAGGRAFVRFPTAAAAPACARCAPAARLAPPRRRARTWATPARRPSRAIRAQLHAADAFVPLPPLACPRFRVRAVFCARRFPRRR